jgi:type IV pilus assembly protein PilX
MQASRSARGMALISALLLLVVMTILSVAMFRSFGTLERIAGNTREKQRALHAATSAQTYAEWWLTSSSGANATAGSNCGAVYIAPAGAQVCSNLIANPSQVPWPARVDYTLPTMQVGAAGTLNDYISAPSFYISYLNGSYDTQSGTQTNSYQIDSMGYAGNTSAVAVAESTYNVSVTYTSQDSLKKYLNHGGP